jgi:hypothetical protein
MNLSDDQIIKIIQLCPSLAGNITNDDGKLKLNMTLDEILDSISISWKNTLDRYEQEVLEEIKVKEEKVYKLIYDIDGIYGNIQYSFLITEKEFNDKKYINSYCLSESFHIKFKFKVTVQNTKTGEYLDSQKITGLPYWMDEEDYFKMAQLRDNKTQSS